MRMRFKQCCDGGQAGEAAMTALLSKHRTARKRVKLHAKLMKKYGSAPAALLSTKDPPLEAATALADTFAQLHRPAESVAVYKRVIDEMTAPPPSGAITGLPSDTILPVLHAST